MVTNLSMKLFNTKFTTIQPRVLIPFIVLICCGVIGVSTTFMSHASTPLVSLEAENGTASSCASVVSDSAASKSKAVAFSPCASASLPLTAGATLPITYSLASLQGTLVYVSPSGSDSGSGAVGSPYATLAKALSVAPSGATIVLRGGTYRQGSVTIGKSVTVVAYPGETPIFDGSTAVTGGWTASGSNSYRAYTPIPVSTGSGIDFGACQNQNASCVGKYPDQVWVGNSQIAQVAAVGAVTSGTFYVDTDGIGTTDSSIEFAKICYGQRT